MIKLKHLLAECHECGRDWNHGHDHEAGMAKNELRDMISNASKIDHMIKEGDNLPGWVSAYISLAADYMHSAAEYLAGESSRMKEPSPGYSINEAKKKPSAGLTKKEKSAVAKKAHAGKDIGKKGPGFEKVAKAAEKKYGSKEAGQKVAAAAMWKGVKRKKSVNETAEVNDSVKDSIENWYWDTNHYIDDLSPEQIEDGIQAHYDEWITVKDQYGSIEDYFEDVEKNGDWY